MAKDIHEWCTSCAVRTTASVRRKHLRTKFDPMAPQATLLPRQHYGIDFYGIHKGEILVTVDLFTRETILTYLRNRTQENVARALLTNVIFQRGWLPWPGTAYAVAQYPAVPDFFFVAPSDEKTVIG